MESPHTFDGRPTIAIDRSNTREQLGQQGPRDQLTRMRRDIAPLIRIIAETTKPLPRYLVCAEGRKSEFNNGGLALIPGKVHEMAGSLAPSRGIEH